MSLDSTIGGSTSESYNSVTDADSYFSGDPFFSTVWSAFDTTTKENWLRLSTRALDRFKHYRGIRQETSQSLEFPRVLSSQQIVGVQYYALPGLYYRHPLDDEDVLVANTIPRNVKRAQLEMLVLLYNSKSDSTPIDGKEIKSLNVLNGLIDIEYSGLKDSLLESAGGGSIATVVSLLKEVVAPLRWRRG